MWCFASFDRWDATEIIGSEGKISFSTFDAQPVILTNTEGRTEFSYDYPAHIQQPLIQQVVDALRGTGTCPSTSESAARTTRIMDKILRGE